MELHKKKSHVRIVLNENKLKFHVFFVISFLITTKCKRYTLLGGVIQFYDDFYMTVKCILTRGGNLAFYCSSDTIYT